MAAVARLDAVLGELFHDVGLGFVAVQANLGVGVEVAAVGDGLVLELTGSLVVVHGVSFSRGA